MPKTVSKHIHLILKNTHRFNSQLLSRSLILIRSQFALYLANMVTVKVILILAAAITAASAVPAPGSTTDNCQNYTGDCFGNGE